MGAPKVLPLVFIAQKSQGFTSLMFFCISGCLIVVYACCFHFRRARFVVNGSVFVLAIAFTRQISNIRFILTHPSLLLSYLQSLMHHFFFCNLILHPYASALYCSVECVCLLVGMFCNILLIFFFFVVSLSLV